MTKKDTPERDIEPEGYDSPEPPAPQIEATAYEPSKEEANWLLSFTPSDRQRIQSSIEDPGLTMRLKATAQSINGMVGKPRLIKDIIMHDATVIDQETGEKRQCVRSVMITPDGVAFAATSDGVVQSLQELSQIYGPPPWEPAINLELVTTETARGYTVYSLLPVTE